jgi:hypothetical protein
VSPEQLLQEFETLREQRIGLISESLEHTDPLVLLADVANMATALYILIKQEQSTQQPKVGFVSNSKRFG